MTTRATMIRDAIFDRLSGLTGYVKLRKSPVPQLQPEDLPALSVFIMRERDTPDGDSNVAEPRFLCDGTIAVAVARGFKDPLVLQGEIDAEIETIKGLLLTDPTFVRFQSSHPKVTSEAWAVGALIYFDPATKLATTTAAGNLLMGLSLVGAVNPSNSGKVGCLFEGVETIETDRQHIREGETYFEELRMRMTFRWREDYPPVVLDDYERTTLTVRPLQNPDAPTLTVVTDQAI